MFSKLKQLLWFIRPESEKITDFSDALDWISTYRKAKNFDTAIFATRELILKNKTSITYYENAQRKIAVIESSNIDRVAKAAKEKRKKVDAILNALYKQLNTLEKNLSDIEKEQLRGQEVEQKKLQQIKFKRDIWEIDVMFRKKDYARALSFSKKLVSDFPNERWAMAILTKSQKLYDKENIKKQKQEKKEEKLKSIFKEVGVEIDKTKDEKDISLFKRFTLFVKQIQFKNLEKREYIKRQKALKDIERLLIQSGTIKNISEEDTDSEIFSVIQSGLSKDLGDFNMPGFDFYGKITGKDKIVGDTFGYHKEGSKTIFYIGDATGHGVQAGFTVASLSKLFFDFSKKIQIFQELFMILNNELKQRLKGRLFITSIFFKFDSLTNKFSFIWAGHDPLYLYKRSTNTVEKIMSGGLPLGVRIITNTSSIKLRELGMENGDVLFGYTDGIVEVKDGSDNMYSLSRMEASFKIHAQKHGHDPKKLYDMMMKDINDFRGAMPFNDDTSLFLFTRNTTKDIVINKAELESFLKEMDIKQPSKKIKFHNKTRQQIIEDLKKERQDRDLKIRLDRLDRLYKMEEFMKLKLEVTLYFREGYVHDKMRFYLEKALENEHKTILRKQNEKLAKKYEILSELSKKWEYELVIKETIDVLFKNGKI